jgi:hypothetical protein
MLAGERWLMSDLLRAENTAQFSVQGVERCDLSGGTAIAATAATAVNSSHYATSAGAGQ